MTSQTLWPNVVTSFLLISRFLRFLSWLVLGAFNLIGSSVFKYTRCLVDKIGRCSFYMVWCDYFWDILFKFTLIIIIPSNHKKKFIFISWIIFTPLKTTQYLASQWTKTDVLPNRADSRWILSDALKKKPRKYFLYLNWPGHWFFWLISRSFL